MSEFIGVIIIIKLIIKVIVDDCEPTKHLLFLYVQYNYFYQLISLVVLWVMVLLILHQFSTVNTI